MWGQTLHKSRKQCVGSHEKKDLSCYSLNSKMASTSPQLAADIKAEKAELEATKNSRRASVAESFKIDVSRPTTEPER